MTQTKVIILVVVAVILAALAYGGAVVYENVTYDTKVTECHDAMVEFLEAEGELDEGERIGACEDIEDEDYSTILMSAVIEANPELNDLAEWGETL